LKLSLAEALEVLVVVAVKEAMTPRRRVRVRFF